MKKLHRQEVDHHFAMYQDVKVDWSQVEVVYELRAHNLVTLDMHPYLPNIKKSYKESAGKFEPRDLGIFKITRSTGEKVRIV